MSIHPIYTTELLRSTYERYLQTIYPFQDESLRQAVLAQLKEPERLIKGPLLEASPPFETGRSIEQLVQSGILEPGFRVLCQTAKASLPLHRPLYVHQENAILNIADRGRNLVVATGTGSGKTESFLIPIINQLLREEKAGTLREPGVRALLLYPMNALANDQLLRLRNLLRGFPRITFGRYTGETIEKQSDAEKDFLTEFTRSDLLRNELLSREEIRANPPHILLTNYAMLEYLLLRPQDTELFDGRTGRHWRFIVVDEAHVYDGASGIEVAMLLRRLKDRVTGGRAGVLTCIATSATIGKGVDDYPKVAEFAENLFGEPFTAADVVGGVRLQLSHLGEAWGTGSRSLYQALLAHDVRSGPAVAEIAAAHGLPTDLVARVRTAVIREQALFELLRGDERVQQLRGLLQEQASLLTNVAAQVFHDLAPEEANEALVELVNLAVVAHEDRESLPLLPARYHVFARALEGAFVCLNRSAHANNAPKVYLNRHETCSIPGCGARVFELATCARCGIGYVVGAVKRQDNQPHPQISPLKSLLATGQGEARRYYVVADQLPAPNEDEALDADATNDDWLPRDICLVCGAVGEAGQLTCHSQGDLLHAWQAPFDGSDEAKMYCPSCSTRSRSTVYRLLTGKDAPVSMLASTLYSQIPPSDDLEMRERPGQGRKLLMFADSRQDAAFFAPFLEQTYEKDIQRRLIFQALQSDEAGREGRLRLSSVARRLQKEAERIELVDDRKDYDEMQSDMQAWLLREMSSWTYQQSLERLGLLSFRLVSPKGWQPPRPLLQPPWNLSPDEAWLLIAALLDTLRRAGALSAPDGVDVRQDMFKPRNRPMYVRDYSLDDPKERKRYAVIGWVPRRGSNSRQDILERVLQRQSPGMPEAKRREAAQALLKDIWDRYLATPSSIWKSHFRICSLGTAGTAYQLDHAYWQWQPTNSDTPLWRCSRCRRLAFDSLRGICMTYGCDGTLQPIKAADLTDSGNYYRHLYQHMQPAGLSVQEHTAQWLPKKAREIQLQFIRGEVNALSCSTTFELGVDVGTLQAVLMRNVPPSTANYLQRAGRAGRRSDSPAYVLTYAQRRSHDLAYYRHPEKMVAGQVATPAIGIRNPKIVQRHMHSVLIAAFLRWCVATHGRFQSRSELRVGNFFLPAADGSTGPSLLQAYLATRPPEVQQALEHVVPEELRAEMQLDDWGWLDQLTNAEGTGLMDLASAEVLADVALYDELAQEAGMIRSEAGHRRAAMYLRVKKTIIDRDLLNYLGQRNVLPKYGFPTDVVPLRTDHIPDPVATSVELQRDLRMAIAEFAPGSQLVAGKKVFTGGGLYRQPNKEWEALNFAVCGKCKRFNKQKGLDAPTVCASCGETLRPNQSWAAGEMVMPEFGFLARRDAALPVPGENRPPRLYASRVYFDDYDVPEHMRGGVSGNDHSESLMAIESISSPTAVFLGRYSRYGKLALVNYGPNGRGFRICLTCGFGEGAPPPRAVGSRQRDSNATKKHNNPRTGADCSGFMRTYCLGHSFMTDVLELRYDGSLPSGIQIPDNKHLWTSVLYALLEGASAALNISRGDLDGTLYPFRGYGIPAMVLYDDVPGGAGHVRRILTAMPEVLLAARERLASCECGPETACHECLWNYRNQPYHEELSRGIALQFIDHVLETKGYL